MASTESEARVKAETTRVVKLLLMSTGLRAAFVEWLTADVSNHVWDVVSSVIDDECSLARAEGEAQGYELRGAVDEMYGG